ncbi:MAG: SDR family oxidoreductase [Pseudomonadota bacterium]
MTLDNRTILVTGANRGIGRATVDALLKKNVRKIYAGARELDRLPAFDDDRVVPIRIDLTDAESIDAAAATANDIDLLINNAGIASFADMLSAPMDVIRADMDVNYYGTLAVTRAFVPVLEQQPDAAIINVVTVAAFVAFPSLPGYSASKAALWSQSQGLRMSLATRGIALHTVNPGPIDTDMAKDIDLAKVTPAHAAEEIVRGFEAGDADIFPDPTSQQMFGLWKQDYRALEKTVYDMHFGG